MHFHAPPGMVRDSIPLRQMSYINLPLRRPRREECKGGGRRRRRTMEWWGRALKRQQAQSQSDAQSTPEDCNNAHFMSWWTPYFIRPQFDDAHREPSAPPKPAPPHAGVFFPLNKTSHLTWISSPFFSAETPYCAFAFRRKASQRMSDGLIMNCWCWTEVISHKGGRASGGGRRGNGGGQLMWLNSYINGTDKWPWYICC